LVQIEQENGGYLVAGLENGEILFYKNGAKVKHIKEVSGCGIKAMCFYNGLNYMAVVDENSRLLIGTRAGPSFERGKYSFREVGTVSSSAFIKLEVVAYQGKDYLVINQGPKLEIYVQNFVKSTPEAPQEPMIKIAEFEAPKGHKECESSLLLVKKHKKSKKLVLVVFWGFHISLYTFEQDELTKQVVVNHRDTVNLTKKLVYVSQFENDIIYCLDDQGVFYEYNFKKHFSLPPV
jgi:hypothetical protein